VILRPKRVALGVACLIGGAFVGVPRDADAAPDTNACISAFDDGQRSKSDKKLRQAQTQLLVCTHESCPAVLRADCAGVLRTVQAALPSIVLAADDGEGHDVTDVTVKIGDAVVADRIDGRALEFDPGTYDFRFERAAKAGASGSSGPLVVHLVLKEGEKNRVVRASFPSPHKAEVAGAVPAKPSRRETVGYVVPAVLGVLGVGALVFAFVERQKFNSSVNDDRQPQGCAPNCTQAQRDDLSSMVVTSNAALGVGIGFVALAGVTWLLLGPRPATTARATATVGQLSW
jgi:hypothetical protein